MNSRVRFKDGGSEDVWSNNHWTNKTKCFYMMHYNDAAYLTRRCTVKSLSPSQLRADRTILLISGLTTKVKLLQPFHRLPELRDFAVALSTQPELDRKCEEEYQQVDQMSK